LGSPVLVLLSGGVDSAALLEYYRSTGTSIQAIHFQYGQPASVSEQRAASEVALHYGIPLRIIDFLVPFSQRGDEVLCRNALFLLVACAGLTKTTPRVALGIHSGTTYYDCSTGFVEDVQRLLDGYFSGTVVVEAPFLKWTKPEVYNFCSTKNVPVHLTYSCERANEPCGDCPSCRDRRFLNAY
jgi:7-cyano-7-deazaguanine synthase